MTTTIDIISASDTITLYPTPSEGGWVYDNATLDAWYALPDVESRPNKRPNAHGSYGLGQIFTGPAKPIVVGQRFGTSVVDALQSRRRLSALFSDGHSVTIRVNDELGSETREAWLVAFDAPFRYGFDHFHFDLAFDSPDPRRYGPTEINGPVIMPTAGSGLVWDLGTVTLYFDWGTAGESGQLEYTNTGGAPTLPRIDVGGAGAFDTGFRITEIETGRELTLNRSTALGQIVSFDSRTQRATLAGGDVTGLMSSRDWFSIPAGATRRYQINPLGSYTGAPTMTLYAASANL